MKRLYARLVQFLKEPVGRPLPVTPAENSGGYLVLADLVDQLTTPKPLTEADLEHLKEAVQKMVDARIVAKSGAWQIKQDGRVELSDQQILAEVKQVRK